MTNLKPEISVVGLKLYKTGVEVVYTGPCNNSMGTTRGTVDRLSGKSLRRLAFMVQNTPVEVKHMITLTYPSEFPLDMRIAKKHLNTMLTNIRQMAKKKCMPFEYVWILEFQRRGAPHFHVFCSDMPVDKCYVSKRWYDIVDSGDSRHLRAGTKVERIREHDGAAKYVTKEVSKRQQKDVPENITNVGRMWGASKGFPPSPLEEMAVMDKKELMTIVRKWKYSRLLDEYPLKYLYSAAEAVKQSVLDNDMLDRLTPCTNT